MGVWVAEMFASLFGICHRTRNTVIAIFVILMVVVPSFRYAILIQLQNLAIAAMGPLLLLGIMVYAFRRLLGPLFPGGSHRRH